MKGFKGLITVLKKEEKKAIPLKDVEKKKFPIKFNGLISY